MEKSKVSVKILSIVVFLLTIINCSFAFGYAASTSFIQIFFVVSVVGSLIAALYLTKDINECLPVIGATFVYFGYMIVRMLIYVIDSSVSFFQGLALSNMIDKLNYGNLSSTEQVELSKKIADLDKVIDCDSFGKFLDVFLLVFAILFVAFVVYLLIMYLKSEKFEDTLLGKFTNKVLNCFKSSKKES